MSKYFFGAGTMVAAIIGLATCGALAQHAHINAGAFSTAPDSRLYFVNGANFATNSGFVMPMTLTTNPPYAGLYRGSVTFASLPATLATGGPAFGHAAFGAFLELEVVGLTGPGEGALTLWQEDEDTGATALRFTLPVGTQTGTNRFVLTESDGSAGSDPYGHIHGRQFTVTRPGLYTVGLRILDTSANGANGGPIHQSSDVFQIYFQAGWTLAALTKTNQEATLTFGSLPGMAGLEATSNIADPNSWKVIAGPIASARAQLQSLIDPQASSPEKFYRLRVTPP